MKSKQETRCIACALAAAYCGLIFFPAEVSAAVVRGLKICTNTILPALFPYLILTDLALQLTAPKSPIFLNILLGTLGGYPLGAKTTADLYHNGYITGQQAEQLLFFACNAGPGFILGVLGGKIYGSMKAGILLLSAHLAAAFLCWLLLPGKKRAQPCRMPHTLPKPLPQALVAAVTKAGTTLLSICSLLTFFSLLTAVIDALPLPPAASAVCKALVEFSGGCLEIAALNIPWHFKLSLTAAAVSFGGLCVLMQTISVLEPVKLSIKPYLCGKLLQSILAAILAYPLALAVFPALPTAAGSQLPALQSIWWCVVPLILFSFIFPLEILVERRYNVTKRKGESYAVS